MDSRFIIGFKRFGDSFADAVVAYADDERRAAGSSVGDFERFELIQFSIIVDITENSATVCFNDVLDDFGVAAGSIKVDSGTIHFP